MKHEGKYYAYYHGTDTANWLLWTLNVTVSDDLIHWTKYENNPIIGEDHSSGAMIHDGEQYRMYAMHPEVNVFHSKKTQDPPVTDHIADVNNDKIVNIVDLISVAQSFGSTGENLDGDVDTNGQVDITDLIIVARHFGLAYEVTY